MNFKAVQNFVSKDHQEIAGWFFGLDQVIFFELFSLQNQLGVHGDVCEVGVYQGKSLVMLSLLKSETDSLVGFDLFEGEDLSKTKENLERYGDPLGVNFVQGLTSELSEEDLRASLPGPLRFLHIDAGHEYHEVMEQLEIFLPYVSYQGIIAMDDYQDREFPGVEAAVLDMAEIDRPRRFVPFFSGENKMYLCAEAYATPLQKLILDLSNFKDKCRLTRVRDFNILISSSKLPIASSEIKKQLDELAFPRTPEHASTGNQKAARYSQLRFGSGNP